MSSESIFDIPALIAPISEETPVGIDVREEASDNYYTVKDARNTARSNERSRLFDDAATHGIEAEWRTVMEVAPRILQEESKDLEIATWLVEAAVRYHGFKGLKEGFELISNLIEQYWDDLYPMPDEDGIETKVAPLTGLNGEGGEGTLLAPLRSIPFTDDTGAGEYSFWQYQQAREISRINDDGERQERMEASGVSLGKIDQAVSETSPEFYAEILADLSSALGHYKTINDQLDNHCGMDAPPASNIRQILEEIEGAIRHLAGHKIVSPDNEASESSENGDLSDTSSDGGSAQSTPSVAGPVQSREQAFKQLDQISQFFKTTEPHSPLSYLLQKSVRWGKMSLPELMKELLPDDSAREHFSDLTGAVIEEDED
ncbi:MAG: type VI secretion system protein TssA [Pseudomonadales bacterium]|nr:type VI secretion system protein TssA [Pseudomonadales bacterium]